MVGDPQSRIEPAGADPDSPAGRRVAFACEVRAELDRRKRLRGILSYDDLLSQLARALDDPDSPARTRMRARWRIVLVDEFQDTDPVQWQVLDRAFSGHATMVLIGDPKQAIYAFRGGDVTTYLAGAVHRGHDRDPRRQLAQRRAPCVGALQALLAGAELGDEQIVVRAGRRPPPASPGSRATRPAPRRSGCGSLRREELGRRGSRPLADGRRAAARRRRPRRRRTPAAGVAARRSPGASWRRATSR